MQISRPLKNLGLLVVLLSAYGCAVSMATKQPDKKNLKVLAEGTPMQDVRAELGQPVWTGNDEEGSDVDVFQFIQGYSKGAKAGRALLHGLADVYTLGLWEVIGTTAETVASGTKLRVTVTYDQNQRVKTARVQDGQGKDIQLKKPTPSPSGAPPRN